MTAAPDAADEELARRARAGDTPAFEALVHRYQDRVYRLSRRLTGNTADAEEAVQDTFLRVFRRLGSFRAESRFSTWLYRVAANSALMVARARRRRRSEPLDPMASAGVLVAMLSQVAAHRYGFEFWGIRTSDSRRAMAELVFWTVTGQKPPT